MTNEVTIAEVPPSTKNGKMGRNAPNAVADPVIHASRSGDPPCSGIFNTSRT